ncbi:reverse transcriptase domain-containing protein [Tanacetum coccineum]
MHYVGRTLHDAERNYAPLEKAALVLRHVSRRLRRERDMDGGPKRGTRLAGENQIVRHGGWSVVQKIIPNAYAPWGIDFLGPLSKALGKVKFVIVAIYYSTKWIEAKPLARMTGKEVKKFVWGNIICRFGLPKIIVTDNGTNFINDPFKSWSLMEGIKTRLGQKRKGWVDELPNVLWAHRTSLKTNNGETPYCLTFKSEAVIPAEIGKPIHWAMMIKEGEGNEEEMRLNLDLLQERREATAIREARYNMKNRALLQ